mmetsp:Transcript_102654/g.162215  ORF Transcript_102654/g.162215 Transcript_102654/m.162215 type:complete len:507 (-) Transcript_102654:120-1640(-)|eukprot:CAMPEP_0169348172 /NCGR_PEP_ID=MMETSP1017-20121227/23032_1 /TAXON_ID=342587 /ORGANISM="Karlodinium micrum, Strain CCMP2283" /LENGTH=506 /DNA_ID=CAMNT_0009444205 /DNA_START=38 /DNA_END=1558 /DNA_ORIENTATION=+
MLHQVRNILLACALLSNHSSLCRRPKLSESTSRLLLANPTSTRRLSLTGLPKPQLRVAAHTSCNEASTISERDLKATFFAFDADSSGTIDREELTIALKNLGLSVPSDVPDVGDLLSKYDADRNGKIDFAEFKKLIMDEAFIGVVPQTDISYAMNLFRKYDENDSGSIDKNEFRAIASQMQTEAKRRQLISLMAGAIGSVVVAEFSNEFQWAQRTFRSLYVDKPAEDAMQQLFPTAMLSSNVDRAIASTLSLRGFTPDNTIFGHSVCSDEVNNRREQLIPLMINRWREGFSLGGLGGLPFAGKSGFKAFLGHVPDNGKLLIVFAPHVGVEADGRLGALQRDGQSSVSTACGAAIGAYKALQKKKKSPSSAEVLAAVKDDTDLFDPQLEKIVELLASRLDGIDSSMDPIAFVTYQMYAIVRELLDACIAQAGGIWDQASEVSVVGGIIINRRKGGDFFQPLSFETCRKGVPSVDLFEETFGQRPALGQILGSEAAASRVYTRDRPKF